MTGNSRGQGAANVEIRPSPCLTLWALALELFAFIQSHTLSADMAAAHQRCRVSWLVWLEVCVGDNITYFSLTPVLSLHYLHKYLSLFNTTRELAPAPNTNFL